MRFDIENGKFVECDQDQQRPAVIGSDAALSWEEFRRSVGRWVAEARGVGIGADVPVVIHGHKEAEFMVALTGCLELGAPFVPVDEIYPEERVQRIAAIVQAPVIYRTGQASFRKLVHGTAGMQEKGLAYVIFTSGSTGEPKGVQIGRDSVLTLVEWMHDCFDMGRVPVFMNQAPFSFDLSMYEVFSFLHEGGTIVLNSRQIVADAAGYYPRLKQQAVSVWVSTPSFAHQQLLNKQFTQQYLPDLKTFLFCGKSCLSTWYVACESASRTRASSTPTGPPRSLSPPPGWSSTSRYWPLTTPCRWDEPNPAARCVLSRETERSSSWVSM